MLDCLKCLRLNDCFILASIDQFEKNEGISVIVIKCKSFLEGKQ